MKKCFFAIVLILLFSISFADIKIITKSGILNLKNNEEIELGEVHNGALLIIKFSREAGKGISWDSVKALEGYLPLYWKAFNDYSINDKFLELGIGIPKNAEQGAYKLKVRLIDNDTKYAETISLSIIVKHKLLNAHLKSIEPPLQGRPFKIVIEFENNSIAKHLVKIKDSLNKIKKEISVDSESISDVEIEFLMEDYGKKEFYLEIESLENETKIYIPLSIDVKPSTIEKFRPIKNSFAAFALNLLPFYLFFELLIKCLL